MNLLIIDPRGFALDLAMRAQRDGHKVKLALKDDPKCLNIGKGLVPVVNDFRPHLRWANLVFVADNVLYLREIDAYRKDGGKVIGPSSDAAEWELDRSVGMDVLRAHGIAVPMSTEFNDYDKAIAFVKKEDQRFVSKPSGDANKALSYVAKSPVDLVYMLERWKKAGSLKAPFLLQEFIDGIEMAVGGWFGPGGFNEGWCENFEFKKLMNDDMGCATGEQGTVLRYVKTSKLASKVLIPLTDTLLEMEYVGYIDVNTIIEEDGSVWPLEFTMRPGWPTFNIQAALQEGDSVQWMTDLISGRDARNVRLDEVAIGVVMSIPDYPYSHVTRKEVTGVPIYGATPSLWEHIHPCEMMLADAPNEVQGKIVTMPMPCTAGDYVLVMTATGCSVKQAKDRAYRRLRKLTVPNSPMYRTDIGDRLSKQLPILQRNGFAKSLEFSTVTQPASLKNSLTSRSTTSSRSSKLPSTSRTGAL